MAWELAIARRDQPSTLIFTRQNTAPQPRTADAFADIRRGGYVLLDEQGTLDAVIIATGSEVEVAVAAAEQLSAQGKGVRVVSMPSTDVFLAQDTDYRDRVLPPQVRARVAVDAAHPDYWYRFVGLDGAVVGIDRFGLSAPGGEAMAVLGITADNVVATVERVLDNAA